MEQLETQILNSTDTEGIIGVLAWIACDRDGCRRFVARKAKEATVVAKCETVCDDASDAGR